MQEAMNKQGKYMHATTSLHKEYYIDNLEHLKTSCTLALVDKVFQAMRKCTL